MNQLKLLLIDKDPVTCSALEVLLDDDERLRVEGSARNEEEGLRLLEERWIDVVLLDVNVNNKTFYRPLQRLKRRFPYHKVLTLLYEEQDVIERLGEIGLDGYFLKNRDLAELPDALVQVHETGTYLPGSADPLIPDPQGILSVRRGAPFLFGDS